jgi:AraC family transcriptional regulator
MEERLVAISKALKFIEQHLREDIRVGDMAVSCGYSLYHFIRLFDQTVHHTPYDYLIRRRLAEAAQEILTNRRRLLDIALDYRFQNAETFTRAFYRVYRVQPSQARKSGLLDTRLMLQERRIAQLVYFQDRGIPIAKRLTLPQRYLAGYPFPHDIITQDADAIFAGIRSLFPDCSGWFWVSTYSFDIKNCPMMYFAGCEITDCSNLPPDLYIRCMPAGDWVVFQQEGLLENINFARDYIYQSWHANTGEDLSSPLEVGCFLKDGDQNQFTLSIPLFKAGTHNL